MAKPWPKRNPERPWAVNLMHRFDALRCVLTAQPVRRALRRRIAQEGWPVVDGAYVVGNPREAVAVCTLTDNDLIKVAAQLPGVAIAGRVYTANLGLEKIVLNVTANPYIRFVLLCGRDSPLFQPGQTLTALCANGITPDRRVVGAEGYLPVLGNVPLARIEQFRRQIELVDCTGQTDPAALAAHTRALAARTPGPFRERDMLPTGASARTTDHFALLRPGGKRQPLAYDPNGYFVITLDRAAGEIVVLLAATIGLPYWLRTATAAPGSMRLPLREPLRPHFWLAFCVAPLTVAHLWPAMSQGWVRRVDSIGLYLASVAFLFMCAQILMGLRLRDARKAQRGLHRLHFWTMACIAGLTVGHVAINGVTLRVLFT